MHRGVINAADAAQREWVFAKSARDQRRLVEKLLKLDGAVAERFYALKREQFNPDLTVPDAVVEECISMGTFQSKRKNHRPAATGGQLDVC